MFGARVPFRGRGVEGVRKWCKWEGGAGGAAGLSVGGRQCVQCSRVLLAGWLAGGKDNDRLG